jgi:hypothetical protein
LHNRAQFRVYLCSPLVIEQNIETLDVAMNELERLQVLKPFANVDCNLERMKRRRGQVERRLGLAALLSCQVKTRVYSETRPTEFECHKL